MRADLRHAAMPAMIVVSGVLSLLHAAGLQQPPDTQLPTFRAASDMVRVDVSVVQNGRHVTGLDAEDFEILDRGVPQQVTDLSFERLPIDVTVALDLSASVRGGTLEILRAAIDRLEEQLRPADRLSLVNFNMRVRRVADWGAAGNRASDGLSTGVAGGATSIFDTLVTLLADATPVDRRHLVILFSDGADTLSITEPETVLAVAARTTATVAFVSPIAARPTGTFGSADVRQPGQASSRLPAGVVMRAAGQSDLYEALAQATGGVVVRASGDDVRRTFSRLLEDFRSSYVVYYAPSGVERMGFHPVDVRVRRSGTFEIRARRGYQIDR